MLLSSAVAVVSFAIASQPEVERSPSYHGPGEGSGHIVNTTQPASISFVTLIVSFGTLLITAVGTASTVLLGWRNEKRQSAEFQLRIQQLEIELAKARQQSNGAGGD